MALSVVAVEPQVSMAINEFDRAIPALNTMRNVFVHMDEYALDGGDKKTIKRGMLQVSQWEYETFKWLDMELNTDDALKAAITLYEAIRNAFHSYKTLQNQ